MALSQAHDMTSKHEARVGVQGSDISCRSESSLITVDVPFDVLCEIIACTDVGTLIAFSTVNRECTHEADKHLWQTIETRLPLSRIASRFSSPSQLPRWVHHVRNISLQINNEPPFDELEAVECFCRVVRRCARLVYLRVDCLPDYFVLPRITRAILDSLTSPGVDFQLKTMDVPNARIDSHLISFLASQPSIEDLRLGFSTGESPLPVSQDIIPRLARISGVSNAIGSFIHGRPVWSIDALDVPDHLAFTLALSTSAAPITRLRICMGHFIGLLDFIDAVALNAPDIECLEIRTLCLTRYTDTFRGISGLTSTDVPEDPNVSEYRNIISQALLRLRTKLHGLKTLIWLGRDMVIFPGEHHIIEWRFPLIGGGLPSWKISSAPTKPELVLHLPHHQISKRDFVERYGLHP